AVVDEDMPRNAALQRVCDVVREPNAAVVPTAKPANGSSPSLEERPFQSVSRCWLNHQTRTVLNAENYHRLGTRSFPVEPFAFGRLEILSIDQRIESRSGKWIRLRGNRAFDRSKVPKRTIAVRSMKSFKPFEPFARSIRIRGGGRFRFRFGQDLCAAFINGRFVQNNFRGGFGGSACVRCDRAFDNGRLIVAGIVLREYSR